MNFLAHSFLAFGDEDMVIGQFIADDIKGKKFHDFPSRISIGIQLHRFVDHFTDTHASCLELRKLLRPELGLFSGIAIDVFFDHVLATQWSEYHDVELPTFNQNVYSILSTYEEKMGEKRKYIYRKMAEQDWLGRYHSMEGIELTLQQMSRRIPEGSILLKSPDLLEKHKKFITEVFEIFFPQLIYAAKSKLDTFAA